ncbi:MAG TPA: PatB family C-S lyase, partial [Chloroflexota bacterium]
TFSAADLRSRPGIKWHRYADDVLPAWIAEMDYGVAEPIERALRRLADEACYGYEPPGGPAKLADAFADHMQECFGWQAGPEHVVPVADLVQALFTLVNVFSERGQGVVLQTPIYPPFLNAVRESGRRLVEHRLLDDGSRFVVDTASLPGVFGADVPLMLLCNPHNPTGRMLERGELEAIAAAAIERDAVIVSDEVHADLAYPGRRHIPLASLGPDIAERTVTLTSATKAYNIPGLRCGLMAFGSAALRDRFRAAIPDRMLGTVNRFGIEATVCAWRECTPWLAGVMEQLRTNRECVRGFFESELTDVGMYAPEATYLTWLDCSRLALPGGAQAFFLERARVALNDGADFGPPGQGHVRLNFATTRAILDEILGRMAGAVQRR